MKVTWIAYAATGALSVAAGVAIAGLPTDPPSVTIDAATIEDGEITSSTSVTFDQGDTVFERVPGNGGSTVGSTNDGSTNDGSADTVESSTPPTTQAPATTVETTTTEATTTTTEAPLVERSALEVAVANAAGVPGLAGDTVDALAPLGYTQLAAVSADDTAFSVVFYQFGLEREAARLAEDAGLFPTAVAPMSDAPFTDPSIGGAQLMLLLGEDFTPLDV